MVLGRWNHVPASFFFLLIASEDGERLSQNPLQILLLCVGKTATMYAKNSPEGRIARVCVCVRVCVSVSIHLYIYIYVYACIHVYTRIYMCTYIAQHQLCPPTVIAPVALVIPTGAIPRPEETVHFAHSSCLPLEASSEMRPDRSRAWLCRIFSFPPCFGRPCLDLSECRRSKNAGRAREERTSLDRPRRRRGLLETWIGL